MKNNNLTIEMKIYCRTCGNELTDYADFGNIYNNCWDIRVYLCNFCVERHVDQIESLKAAIKKLEEEKNDNIN